MRRGVAIGVLLLTGLLLTTPVARAQVNYPLEITLELRDANGNRIDSFHSVCPAEGVSVHSTGWLPLTFVHATFHSDPVDLGEHQADTNGIVDFTFRIADVQNGQHTLILDGTGATGLPRSVQASFLCQCKQPTEPPFAVGGGPVVGAVGGAAGGGTAVAGRVVDNGLGAFGKTDVAAKSEGAFGKTGAEFGLLVFIALDLVAVGLVLRLAGRPRQRTAG